MVVVELGSFKLKKKKRNPEKIPLGLPLCHQKQKKIDKNE